jgi:hypothetical protein
MKTCRGDEIKKRFEAGEKITIHEAYQIQKEAQLAHNKLEPNPLAINPQYCNAYCTGYFLAIEQISQIFGGNKTKWDITIIGITKDNNNNNNKKE